MNITAQTDACLTLSRESIPEYALSLSFIFPLVGGGLFFTLSRFEAPTAEPLLTIYRLFLLLLLFATALAFAWFCILLALSLQNPVETCTFHKGRGVAIIVTRVMWRLWARQTRVIRLRDITSVTLQMEPSTSDMPKITARLAAKSRSIKLASGVLVQATVMGGLIESIRRIDATSISGKRLRSEEKSIVHVSRQISDFLGVPLQWQIGTETVTQGLRRFGQPRVKPIYCAGCGGPLPPLRTGAEQQTCPYCGTTMRVEWHAGSEN